MAKHMTASVGDFFQQQHQQLDALLQAHLLDVIGNNLQRSQRRLQRWHDELLRHIEVEERCLLPHVPDGARWPARLYRLEHERIVLLAQQYAERVRVAAARRLDGCLDQRRNSLALLDAAHALRHLLEHHHEREQIALGNEIPIRLQAGSWIPLVQDAIGQSGC